MSHPVARTQHSCMSWNKRNELSKGCKHVLGTGTCHTILQMLCPHDHQTHQRTPDHVPPQNRTQTYVSLPSYDATSYSDLRLPQSGRVPVGIDVANRRHTGPPLPSTAVDPSCVGIRYYDRSAWPSHYANGATRSASYPVRS